MYEFLQRDLDYVIRADEVLWGCLLVAVTLSIHGVGMYYVMRASGVLLARTAKLHARFGMGVLILVAWMIVVVHLLEVVVWASLAACAAYAGDVSLVRAISSQANGPRIIRESTAALLVGAGLTAVLFWAVGQATGY